jgi:hypothetical protein
MGFEALLMDLGFCPGEWFGGVVVGRDEGVDMGLEFGDGVERCPSQRFTGQDGEPNLDLIEPGRGGRREVEMDVAVALGPRSGLRSSTTISESQGRAATTAMASSD